MTGFEQEIHKLLDESEKLNGHVVATSTINALKRLSYHMEGMCGLETLKRIYEA